MKNAWIKIWNTWKGGQREVVNIQAAIFEKNLITGFYRCYAYREFSNGGNSIIEHVHESDIVKFI